MINRYRGFSLIEMIIFIVVMGILSLVILAAMNLSAERSPELTRTTEAAFLAQRRMEVLLMYKRSVGFTAFTSDPCTAAVYPAAICTVSGYTVTSAITSNWTGNANLKKVDVTVVGTDVNFTLSTITSNYT